MNINAVAVSNHAVLLAAYHLKLAQEIAKQAELDWQNIDVLCKLIELLASTEVCIKKFGFGDVVNAAAAAAEEDLEDPDDIAEVGGDEEKIHVKD